MGGVKHFYLLQRRCRSALKRDRVCRVIGTVPKVQTPYGASTVLECRVGTIFAHPLCQHDRCLVLLFEEEKMIQCNARETLISSRVKSDVSN